MDGGYWEIVGCFPLHLGMSLSDKKCFVIETTNGIYGIEKLSSFRMCDMR
jgi:hypothetical protein